MTPHPSTASAERTVISAGNPELDSRMGGGIPVSSLVLIEGGSGAGKSVLSQQMIFGSLQDRFTVALFTSENTVKSLVSQMRSIDLDILDHLLLGNLRVYPVEFARIGARAPAMLLNAMRDQENSGLIFVDSLTSAIADVPSESYVRGFFEECKRLCAAGKTIIVTLHAQGVDDDLMGSIRSMCDAHLRVRSEQDGQRLIKTLEVAKIRGAASVTGAIVGFEVEPGWGMRVIPISKARG